MNEYGLHVRSVSWLITISDAKAKQKRYMDHWAVDTQTLVSLRQVLLLSGSLVLRCQMEQMLLCAHLTWFSNVLG